jgi:hypothetical protein
VSAETRVLVATMVLAALLTGLAHWLAQRGPPRRVATHDDIAITSVELEVPDDTMRPRPLADASLPLDATARVDVEAQLTEILVPRVCALRADCGCGPYPPERSCEDDVRRDVHRLWSEHALAAPLTLVSDEQLEAELVSGLGCLVVRPALERIVVADAIEGERCGAFLCRDGLACIDHRCTRDAQRGEPCNEGDDRRGPLRFCDAQLTCVAGRCEPPLSLGSACTWDGLSCEAELACDGARCVPRRREGEACDPEDPWHPCLAGLACLGEVCRSRRAIGEPCDDVLAVCEGLLLCTDGRCTRMPQPPSGAMLRLVRAGRPDDAHEWVDVGTPCTRGSDCGWGLCEGEGPLTCMRPGPHSILPSTSPRDDEPLAQEGEACDTTRCAEGLVCDRDVATPSRCVPPICALTTYFAPQERRWPE